MIWLLGGRIWVGRPSLGSRRTPAFDESARARGACHHTGERDMRDSAGRGGGLDLIVLLEGLQSVPEPYASAEQDRNDHDVHVVDEPCREEVADRRGTSADPYVQAVGSLAGSLERLGRRSVDEVKGGAALHLDRRARVMGKNEHRCVERRDGAPPTPSTPALVPSRGGGTSRPPHFWGAPPDRGPGGGGGDAPR